MYKKRKLIDIYFVSRKMAEISSRFSILFRLSFEYSYIRKVDAEKIHKNAFGNHGFPSNSEADKGEASREPRVLETRVANCV